MTRILLAALFAFVIGAPASADELSGTLKKIKDSGTITVGYRENAPPFSSLDAKKKPVGYSIDLCERIVTAVKQELTIDDLKVQYVPVTPQNRMDMVRDGKVDIECGASTDTFSRQRKVDFTYMTFVTGTILLAKTKADIATLTDLAGKSVGVARGTTTEGIVKARIKAQFINAKIVMVDDHDAGLQALENDEIAAYATDRVVAIGLARRSPARNELMLTDEALSYEPYAFMVRRDDSAFRRVANQTLSTVYVSGEIIKIFQKWFSEMGVKPSPMLQAMYVLQARPN